MNNRQGNVKFVLAAVLVMGLVAITPARAQTAIDGNLQVFTDMSLIESLTNAVLKQHEPGQRPNGTGSVNAGYFGGEMITKPITFTGRRLVMNYATSAAGSIRVEIQDINGTPKTGYALANFPERYLDEVEGVMKWGSVVDVGSLDGTTIRLRFVLKDADLYAMRFANPDNVQYSVSYNANGASGGTAPATQQKEKGVSLVLAMNAGDPLLYRTGYTFAGWNTAADGNGTSYAECATYTNDATLTLHARWAANPTTYAVSFNKNGATSGFGPAALNKIQGVGLTLPSSITLAKTGYTFSGWNTAAAGNGTDYAVGASYTTDSAITLYANWLGLTGTPTILAGPEDITVMAGQTAAFSVTASGTAPLAYQWYKNNAVIGGATASSYTTPATTTNDSGTQFKVTVTNAYGAATSSVATLTVNLLPVGTVVATGGTVTNYTVGGTNWTAHIFRTVGTSNLIVTAGGNVDVLVVGGGGGGGRNGGGGGAGGLVYSNGFPLVAGTYTVSVGDGGAAGTGGSGGNGTNSVFSNSVSSAIVAIGGGGGADLNTIGLNGGSGGGGGGVTNVPAKSGGTNTVGQGYMGGSGGVLSVNWGGNGGGGGAGSAGLPGDNSSNGGNGGAGVYVSAFTGVVASTVGTTNDGWFAGGGGGAEVNGTAGAGGRGGGGRSNNNLPGTAGSPNTGGGGGGGCWNGTNANNGGAGGAGIVIVRYVSGGVDPFEAWRAAYFTSAQLTNAAISSATADPDEDGLNNEQEYLAGTNPTNALSCLVISAATNNPSTSGTFVLSWQSVSNKMYTVMAATNLLIGFADLATNIQATPAVNVHTDSVENAGQRFYRIKLE